MSKHGNNNAKHVLKAEGKNLRWFANDLMDLSDSVDDNVNLLAPDGNSILQLNELLLRLDNTRRELATIIPKEHRYDGKTSAEQHWDKKPSNRQLVIRYERGLAVKAILESDISKDNNPFAEELDSIYRKVLDLQFKEISK